MVERVGTRGNVIDYSILAGKGRNADSKQVPKIQIHESSLEVKNKASSLKKKGKKLVEPKDEIKGCGSNNSTDSNDSDCDGTRSIAKNKMAAKTASPVDEEIVFQKHIHKTYIGSVHDSKTGSMMPVLLQTEVDGTKQKVPCAGLDQGNLMGAGDGSSQGKKTRKSRNKKSVVGLRQKAVGTQDSDLAIVGTISGDERVNSMSNSVGHYVEKPDLEINTSVNSSDDDLDLDIIQTHRGTLGGKKPPAAHSTKVSPIAHSRKIIIPKKQKDKVEPINLKMVKRTGTISGKRQFFLEIPVIQTRQKPRGKAGKSNRIISAKVRENEEALLALMEETDKLSSNSDTQLDDDPIVVKQKAQKNKIPKVEAKRIKYSLEKLKSKLAEERRRRDDKKTG